MAKDLIGLESLNLRPCGWCPCLQEQAADHSVQFLKGVEMKEVGSRRRNQPAPPCAVFDDLVDPDRQPVRRWLVLEDDEIAPTVVESNRPAQVLWSSLWIKRPDASVQFELTAARGGTDLRWILSVDDPVPHPSFVNHMRQRINVLINANLRYTYGQ